MTAWKNAERRVARRFGAERNPLSGSNSGISASDSRHTYLFIETKQGKQCLPLCRLYDKTSELAKKEHKLPLVCIQGKNRKGFLVVVHIDDLESLIDELKLVLAEGTPTPCTFSPLAKKPRSSLKRKKAPLQSCSTASKTPAHSKTKTR